MLLVLLFLGVIYSLRFEMDVSTIMPDEGFEIIWEASEDVSYSTFDLYRVVREPDGTYPKYILEENMSGSRSSFTWKAPGGEGDNGKDTFFMLVGTEDDDSQRTIYSEVFRLDNRKMYSTETDYPYGYNEASMRNELEEDSDGDVVTMTKTVTKTEIPSPFEAPALSHLAGLLLLLF